VEENGIMTIFKKRSQNMDSTQKKGFWASLSYADYVELAVYVFIAVCFLVSLIDHFS
jgi:hypothetical protein